MPQPRRDPESFRSGRKQVFDVLLAADDPLTTTEVCVQLGGAAKRHIDRVLQRLIDEKLIEIAGSRKKTPGGPGSAAKVFAPTQLGREVGNDYVPFVEGEALAGWGEYEVHYSAVVNELLKAGTGLTASEIARLTGCSSSTVWTILLFGLQRGLVSCAVIQESPSVIHAHSLTPGGKIAGEIYIRIKAPQKVMILLDPSTADLPAALALLEQLRGMPGVTVS